MRRWRRANVYVTECFGRVIVVTICRPGICGAKARNRSDRALFSLGFPVLSRKKWPFHAKREPFDLACKLLRSSVPNGNIFYVQRRTH